VVFGAWQKCSLSVSPGYRTCAENSLLLLTSAVESARFDSKIRLCKRVL